MNGSWAWWAELRIVLAGTAVALLAGVLTGHLLLCLIAAAVIYLVRHVYNLHRLLRWLRNRKRNPLPDSSGYWAEVYRELYRLDRRARRRKKKLAGIIERFKEAAEATPDGTVILGPNGEIEWLNGAAQRLLGLRYPQDLGQPIGDLVRTPAFTQYLAAGQYEESLQMTSPQDAEVTLTVRVVHYGDEHRLMLARDATRLARLEQVRRDFVANVSHELRSPLTVISGYLETLQAPDSRFPRQWQRPLEQMSRQVARMCRIVEDLLRLSRLEDEVHTGNARTVAVAELLESVRRDTLGLAGEGRSIEIDADAGHGLIGDRDELYSACSNLVINAVQYTGEDGRIRLRWKVDAAGGCIEVRDDGVGVGTEHIPRLTERFYRVDKGRSRAVGGTGLGLAIVKHVLMRHDARLEIESEPGEGSLFRCRFPRARVTPLGDLRTAAKG